MAVMPRKRTPITKDAIKQSLETLEKYNGPLTKESLKHLMTSVGDKLTDREFEEFIGDQGITIASDGRVVSKSNSTACLKGKIKKK